jgi:AcrR family transcriptional regulator
MTRLTVVPRPQKETATRSSLSRALVTSELLDRATRLFAEKGYEATTLLDIANALGISRSALYHYVSTKDDLLTMLVEQVSQGLAEVLAQLGAQQDRSAAERFSDAVALMVRRRAEHPDQFRVLDRSEPVLPEPVGSQHLAAKRRVLKELTQLIEAGIEAGDFRQVEPRTTALAVLGMCNWVAWWFRADGDVDAVVTEITGLVGAMLATDTGSVRKTDTTRTINEIRGLLDRLERRR